MAEQDFGLKAVRVYRITPKVRETLVAMRDQIQSDIDMIDADELIRLAANRPFPVNPEAAAKVMARTPMIGEFDASGQFVTRPDPSIADPRRRQP